jgi:16S rRNA processing protein RimM
MAGPGFLVLGRVAKPHGVRGEVKVIAFPSTWAPFHALTTCWLGPPGGPFDPYRLEADRERGRSVVLKLAGVDSPEAAAALVGHDVAVPRAEAPDPPPGTYYHYDILGLEVVDAHRSLGSVREILETPAHDVYVIQGPAGEWMLPATRMHIRRIDLEARRIEIEPLTGLAAPTSEGGQNTEAV